MFPMKGSYSDLWKAIIRPPRDEYKEEELGPTSFVIKRRHYQRTDIQLKNERGLTIECSHFEPADDERVAEQLPCVIFLHGNCSSRIEALPCLDVLLPQNITLFALDLCGSGKSEGEYISLGWYEREDVKVVIDHLRNSGRVSTIGLWGRSMGAVTALLHAHRDPSIAGLVLDSPFADLKILAEELCKTYTKIPKLVLNIATKFIRKTIRSKAKFDINELCPIKHVGAAFIPALFACAKGDDFILPHHTQDLYTAYAGDKNLVTFEGDHNSSRPDFFFNSASIFFYNTLMCDKLPVYKPRSRKSSEKKKSSQVVIDEEDELLRMAIEASLKSMEQKEEVKPYVRSEEEVGQMMQELVIEEKKAQ